MLVCASRDETMPLAILEALSLGKAVVTTSVGGISEYLEEEVNALVVRPEDPGALASALRRCLQEPALRNCLAERGRQTFHRDFSIGALGRSFAKLLRQAAKLHP